MPRTAEAAKPGETLDACWDRLANKFNMRRNYPIFGAALVEAHRITPFVLAILPSIIKHYHELTNVVSTRCPLSSVVSVALDRVPFVFVFTDYPDESVCGPGGRARIRVLPLMSIPETQRQLMANIKIIGWGSGPHAE